MLSQLLVSPHCDVGQVRSGVMGRVYRYDQWRLISCGRSGSGRRSVQTALTSPLALLCPPGHLPPGALRAADDRTTLGTGCIRVLQGGVGRGLSIVLWSGCSFIEGVTSGCNGEWKMAYNGYFARRCMEWGKGNKLKRIKTLATSDFNPQPPSHSSAVLHV